MTNIDWGEAIAGIVVLLIWCAALWLWMAVLA